MEIRSSKDFLSAVVIATMECRGGCRARVVNLNEKDFLNIGSDLEDWVIVEARKGLSILTKERNKIIYSRRKVSILHLLPGEEYFLQSTGKGCVTTLSKLQG